MSSQCGRAQSCIFWNSGIVRLKNPLYYAVVISLDVNEARSMKLAWCNLPKYLSLKGQISQTSLGLCCSYCCDYAQGRFPLYWTGAVFGNYFVAPRLGGVSFYCSQEWGESLQLQLVWNRSGSIQCALSMPVCLPGSLPRFLLGPQQQPGGTIRGSGFTGYSFEISFFSGADLFGTHHAVDGQPHSLLLSLGFLAPAFLPFPEAPAHLSELTAACVLCGECLIPLQVQIPHVGTKASWRKSLHSCQRCCLPEWSSV